MNYTPWQASSTVLVRAPSRPHPLHPSLSELLGEGGTFESRILHFQEPWLALFPLWRRRWLQLRAPASLPASYESYW